MAVMPVDKNVKVRICCHTSVSLF